MLGGEQMDSDYAEGLALCHEGLRKYRDLDFIGAIEDLKKSLLIIGDEVEVSYKLFGHLGTVYFANKQYEEERNETKRQIKILRRELVQDFIEEFESLVAI